MTALENPPLENPPLQTLPLRLKYEEDTSSIFSYSTCSLAVQYWVIHPNKRTILDYGCSRPCGHNHNKISIHAEQMAIQYCRTNDKRNRCKIFIGRYARDGHLKPMYSCHACSQLATKYDFQDRIFTLDKGKFVSAITDNPEVSLGHRIKHGL